MMKSRFLATLVLVGISSGAAWAESHGEDCALSYDAFEASVPHTDMDECPASLEAGEDTFCRVAVVAEVATVFVFSDSDNCLLKTQSYFEDEYTFVIN